MEVAAHRIAGRLLLNLLLLSDPQDRLCLTVNVAPLFDLGLNLGPIAARPRDDDEGDD